MNKRIFDLRSKLEEQDLDAFIITSSENRYYLSGFSGTAGILLITKDQSFLFTDFRYVEQAKLQAGDFQIVNHEGKINSTLDKYIKSYSCENVGFEGDFVTFFEYENLKKSLKDVELVPVSNMVEEIRMIKDEVEVENIRKAASIADGAFEHVLNIIAPGKTEKEIALELEYFMRLKGASGTSFATIVASGKRSALPHGLATDKVLEKGDLVTMDFGCIYNHYCSDMTRTIVIGNPSPKQKEIYNIVLEAQNLALDDIKAGKATKDIDALSRGYIEQKGYGEYFGHGLGHSVGLFIHERPSLSFRDTYRLKSNMLVTVEPGIYIPNWGGVRIEDLVVVNETGIENLTHSSKDLIII